MRTSRWRNPAPKLEILITVSRPMLNSADFPSMEIRVLPARISARPTAYTPNPSMKDVPIEIGWYAASKVANPAKPVG